jgi:hypothetical protein
VSPDETTRDPWPRGDCEEGPPPGYYERNAEAPRYPTERPKEPTRS